MFSFVLFVLIIILMFWVASVSNRLASLEHRLKSGMQPAAQPKIEPQETFFHAPVTPAPPAQPEKPKASDEEVAAGWLTKIGVVALLFGIVFFLKFAIDHGWIGLWMRIILGLAIGGLFIVLGDIWREKYKQYAAALTGGGVAILYFSIYAAYQFYSLIPQGLAFLIMVAITALAIYLAYRYKSEPLVVLGIAGAFLSPLLLYNHTNQQGELFGYLVLLNVAALVIMARYYWPAMMILSFLGSVFDFSLWASRFSTPENTLPSFLLVLMIFIVYTWGVLWSFRQAKLNNQLPKEGETYAGLLLLLNGLFYLGSVFFLLDKHFHPYLSLVALLGGVAAFIGYALVDRLEFRQLNYCAAAVGTALLSFAIVWQFNGKTMDLWFVILGLFGVVAGTLVKRMELRTMGFLVQFVALLLVLFTPYDLKNYVFLINSKFGLMFLEAIALLSAGWFYASQPLPNEEQNLDKVARVVGSMLIWLAVSWELVEYYRGYQQVNARNLLLSLWWVIYAVVLMVIGAVTRSAIYRKVAIALFALSILKVFLWDVQALELGYRVVSFIVLGVILLSVSYAYQHNKEKIVQFIEGKNQS